MTLKPIPGAPIGAPIPDFPTGEPAPLVVPLSRFTRRPAGASVAYLSHRLRRRPHSRLRGGQDRLKFTAVAITASRSE